MDRERCEALAVGIEGLYTASKLGVTVRAIWPGDDPERFERVTIDQMLTIVRGGAIGTRTVYWWCRGRVPAIARRAIWRHQQQVGGDAFF
jgi:hypothetical protein